MKKIFLMLTAVIVLLGACDGQNKAQKEEISADKIYFFFSNGCPHCHEALEYINRRYPDLKMGMVNVGNSEGYDLFVKCAEKFKLGRYIGTPLFCMGDNYLMGWSTDSEKRFDGYVQPYLP